MLVIERVELVAIEHCTQVVVLNHDPGRGLPHNTQSIQETLQVLDMREDIRECDDIRIPEQLHKLVRRLTIKECSHDGVPRSAGVCGSASGFNTVRVRA